MAFNLNLRLFAMNVPSWVKHKTRAEEIEEIPDYVGVDMSGAGTLSLCNYGAQTPNPDNAAYPWLKTDSSGNPVGWYVNVNGTWKLVTPLIVTSATNPTDTSALWLKIDGNGAPVGFYMYVTGTSTWAAIPVGA